MSQHVTWNRLTFISTAGLTAAAAISKQPLLGEPLPLPALATVNPFLAFVGSSPPGCTTEHRIETYRVEGNVLVVSSELRPALTVVALDDQSGRQGSIHQQVESDAEAIGPISFGSSGHHLYLAAKTHSGGTTLSTLRMEHGSLPTRATATKRIPSIGHPEQLLVREHELLLVATDGVATLPVDHRRGIIGEPKYVVRDSGAASIPTLPICRSCPRSRE